MKCVMCKGGELAPGKTTVKVQRGETLVIIKDVPADVCQDCGEAYLDGNVAKKIERQGEWNEMSVDDISVRVTKGTTPAGGQFIDQGINFIKVESITDDGRIDINRVAHIDDATNATLSRSILKQNDVLFTIAGTIGRVALVSEKILPANTNQAVAIVRPNLEVIVPRFLYYALKDKARAKQIYTRVVQSVQANFSLGELSSLKVLLPPLPEQRAIAHILGTLDDKIELNRRMNETLEAMAQAIFKSWFVDFDPVRAKMEGRPTELPKEIEDLFPDSFEDSELGEIPRGWEVGPINTFAQISIGGQWGKDSKENEDFIEFISLRGVDIEQLRNGNMAIKAVRRWCKKSAIQSRLIKPNEVLIASSGIGPVGRSLWVPKNPKEFFGIEVIHSNFVKKIKCSSIATAIYLDRILFEMRTSGEVWEYINGTSIPNLNDKDLLANKFVIIPPNKILEIFKSIIEPISNKIFSLESINLSMIRDSLLPKLLSGEIKVSGIPPRQRSTGERQAK